MIYNEIKEKLAENPKTWLVTGCAGFIGLLFGFILLRSNRKL